MPEDNHQEFDYIIVGAGSAGCALAHRLSREASRKVQLLEAGGRDSNPMIHIPLGFAALMKDTNNNWCYQTDPEPNMDGRQIEWPRGKVLGGTSSINGMVYIRGQREDYDNWAAQGNQGWSWDEVLPYFKRSEHKAEGSNDYHGYGGPLWVEEVAHEEKLELADIFLQAAVQTGLPYNEDFNGASQEGAGYYQLNIRKGLRQSTAATFLKLCRNRPNLTVQTGALVRRIAIDAGRATAVEYELKDKKKTGVRQFAHARGEIILCGGVINSPQLLELSGVGDRARLESLGIEVKQHLSGVGENLQDHLTVHIQQGLHGANTFYEETRPLSFLKNIFKFLFRRRGLFTHPAAQVGVFFRTSDDIDRPDAQIHYAPACSEYDKRGNMKTAPGTTATVCHLRPESRGSVHIRCTDPRLAPSIRANYLATEGDRKAIVNAVKKVRGMFNAPALDNYRGSEFAPGAQVASDEQILDYVRAEGQSVYHPVGTCKMGQDETAVVDERLRVRGIEGLRVADASIMPDVISGNTNAPAVMIAEQCADMLLEDAGIPVTRPTTQTQPDAQPAAAAATVQA